MRISELGALEIISHEAIILNRYHDTKGIWTIGVGVTDQAGASIKPSVFKGEITVDEAFTMFVDLLPQYERFVHKLLDNAEVCIEDIKQHEYDALVSLAWNVGSIITIKSKTRGTRARISRGDIAGAIDLWRADKELKSRRDKEVALARTGEYKSKTVRIANAGEWGEVLWGTSRRVRLSRFIGKGVWS